MGEYLLYLRDDAGICRQVEFIERPDDDTIAREAEGWVRDGDWGDEGTTVGVRWTLTRDGDEIDEGWLDVDVEPNHARLIARACRRDWESRSCGDDPAAHDWTTEGEGGCDENPGVWSAGGDAMCYASHCRRCGLRRREYRTDGRYAVRYDMPARWCAACGGEVCRHPVNVRRADGESRGEEVSSHGRLEEAIEAARAYAHEKQVRPPDSVTVLLDVKNGVPEYHVVHVS